MAYNGPGNGPGNAAVDGIITQWLRDDLEQLQKGPTHMGRSNSSTAVAETDEATKPRTKPRTKTLYQVLQSKLVDDAEGNQVPVWVPIGDAEGANDIEAVRKATEIAELNEGSFVAVPKRSFRIRNLSAQVRRSVSIN